MSEIATISELFTRPEFIAGLVAGVILLMPFLVSERAGGLPGWGIAIATATLVGVQFTIGRQLGLTYGAATMALGGWLLDREDDQTGRIRARWHQLGAWGVVLIGAIVVSWRGGLSEPTWIPFVTPLVAVATGHLLRFWGRRSMTHLGSYLGPLFLMTTIGVWSTVPETETARILLGAAIPLSLATVRGVGGRLSAAGAFALGGVVTWVAAIGGSSRPASIVGAWAGLGVLALLPMLFRSIKGLDSFQPILLFAAHGLVILISGRIIGLWQTALPALVWVAFTYVVAAGVLLIPIPRRASHY